MVNLISDLGYSLDADKASNLLVGIFDATNNLLDSKVTADTYMAVANCLRVGGKKPAAANSAQTSQTPAYDLSVLMPKTSEPQTSSIPDYMIPPVVSSSDNSQSSPEERPAGEGVISETVEPEWLTPKIFKGTSIG